jgi:type II secretory pathway component PulJ
MSWRIRLALAVVIGLSIVIGYEVWQENDRLTKDRLTQEHQLQAEIKAIAAQLNASKMLSLSRDGQHSMARVRAHRFYMQDGKLMLHTENGDYHAPRHGLEEVDREITREEVERNYPEHNYPGLLTEVDDVLAGRRKQTREF